MNGWEWGFLLMSVHLGLHWGMLLGRMKKVLRLESSPRSSALLFVFGAGVSLYGAVVFFKRNFLTYLLLKSEFVYLDYSEPVFLFYADYLALMGLCIFIGHYGTKMLGKFYKRKGPLREKMDCISFISLSAVGNCRLRRTKK